MPRTHNPLLLYNIFHLNLAFSSIEEKDRPVVVQKCYRPLLHMLDNLGFSCGIELSAYTLEEIQRHDPVWIEGLKKLIASGVCELVASGYSQSIGPLMPSDVNHANFFIGNQKYHDILNTIPRIALVNEQAYSSGMIAHYLDAGYEAIVMEWNNPALNNDAWDQEWRYLPQYACDQHGKKIPVIWSNSIFFQKFQRYAHSEKELKEYLAYISSHQSGTTRLFPLYGNDVEIFDFRPGRYHTEAHLGGESEWQRIELLFRRLKDDNRFEIISPSMALDLLKEPGAGNELSLESPVIPIPVKKQQKYNITRWAVTGRDDLGINSACWRIYDSLKREGNRDTEAWQELCYLWSSDFRTHITKQRWTEYLKRLKAAEEHYCGCSASKKNEPLATVCELPEGITVNSTGRVLSIETGSIRIDLNCRRGLAIDGLWFKGVSKGKLCGTLPHGYYDDITLGADFYSAHMVFESPGKAKTTDLDAVDPNLFWDDSEKAVVVVGKMQTELGLMMKRILVYPDMAAVELEYELNWENLPVGSLRLGHVTLLPESFRRDSLFFRTHNGGSQMETFYPGKHRIDHGEPASFLVSAKHALGMTEGVLEIGDAETCLRVTVDVESSALIGLITYAPIKDSYFFRCAFSAREMDETSSPAENLPPRRIKLSITAHVSR